MDNKNKIESLKKILQKNKYTWLALQQEIEEYNINIEYKLINYNSYYLNHLSSIKKQKEHLTNKIEKIKKIIWELENE